jgi:hypothetical protein
LGLGRFGIGAGGKGKQAGDGESEAGRLAMHTEGSLGFEE